MMHTAEALRVFLAHRGEAIVVPGRGGRHWVKLSERQALDVPLGDPAMGGHAGLRWGWRWRSRGGAWCCSIPRAIC
jgi:hypothetical protein